MIKFSKLLPVILLSVVFLAGCATNTDTGKSNVQNPEVSMSSFTFDKTEVDLGVVKQSAGIIKKDFVFTYTGDKPISITGVAGSCACTTGTVSENTLQKGDSTTLTVAFDPNLHEEPEGKFYKTVALVTEPKLDEMPEVKIWAEIDLDLGPEAYKLQGLHQED